MKGFTGIIRPEAARAAKKAIANEDICKQLADAGAVDVTTQVRVHLWRSMVA